jgi:hypothetical protein
MDLVMGDVGTAFTTSAICTLTLAAVYFVEVAVHADEEDVQIMQKVGE